MTAFLRTSGLAVLALAAGWVVQPAAAQQHGRCMAPELVIAKAQAERPSTMVLAQHGGAEAVAIRTALNELVSDEVPAADEITVLRSAKADKVMLLGTSGGCLAWRSVFPLAAYELLLDKALGVAV